MGFESACISSGSLIAHNANRPWTKALGFSLARWLPIARYFPGGPSVRPFLALTGLCSLQHTWADL